MPNPMLILAGNSGSATLKLDLMQVESPGISPHRLARGRVERFGPDAATDFQLGDAECSRSTKNVPDHQAGVSWFLANLADSFGATPPPIAAVVHRVVHGGATFTAPTLLDEGMLAELEALNELAPLHNPPRLGGHPRRAIRARSGCADDRRVRHRLSQLLAVARRKLSTAPRTHRVPTL